jgi:hypothetical protein
MPAVTRKRNKPYYKPLQGICQPLLQKFLKYSQAAALLMYGGCSLFLT